MEIDFFENFKEVYIDINRLPTDIGNLGIRTTAVWDIEKIQQDAERIREAQEEHKQRTHGDLQLATT